MANNHRSSMVNLGAVESAGKFSLPSRFPRVERAATLQIAILLFGPVCSIASNSSVAETATRSDQVVAAALVEPAHAPTLASKA